MTVDSSGNDIEAVGVPVSGRIAFAPFGTPLLTPSQGNQGDITSLMGLFTPIGLLKTDGGPQFAWAASGDPIEFWQEGYSIPSGLADVTLGITAAEALRAAVRAIISGMTPDANNMTVIDGGGHATRWVVYSEEIFKNGAVRRRQAPNVQLASSTEDRSERGGVMGNALSFKINRDIGIGGHFREWVIMSPASGAKTGWNVTLNGSPTGGSFALSVNGAWTAPIAYNANAAAVAAAINALAGVTGISGVTASGTSPIALTFPSAVQFAANGSGLTGGTSPSVTVA
ncbi:hypothetical protein [Microbacterium sp. PM5]|uniref:hypothetical protein n=1 Tax=Microbacterium sp. PM5 TaxID=2014534 RepID=UPI000DD15E91|nr:hypothetical protein [Microbacterium sp. PM5]AXA95462.1 hypothetical protein CEP17_02965 [Microbacterium sp. PM5]